MNETIFLALATFARIEFREAYTNKSAGLGNIDERGKFNNYYHGKTVSLPSKLDYRKIAEVRFRAGEIPVVYYETRESGATRHRLVEI